jgi:hypothetical protein
MIVSQDWTQKLENLIKEQNQLKCDIIELDGPANGMDFGFPCCKHCPHNAFWHAIWQPTFGPNPSYWYLYCHVLLYAEANTH